MKNYEKTLMELMERVIGLENRVDTLELRAGGSSRPFDGDGESEGSLSAFDVSIVTTRSEARAIYMANLDATFKKNGYSNIEVSKANREQGSGIMLSGEDLLRPVRVKFYYSKGYMEDPAPIGNTGWLMDAKGWFSVNLADIKKQNIDIIIFTMPERWTEGEFDKYLFTAEELLKYKDKYRNDNNETLHLYLTREFNVDDKVDDAAIPVRYCDRREGCVDVSEHAEAPSYAVFNTFLKDGGKVPADWKTASAIGTTAQDLINRQFIKESDFCSDDTEEGKNNEQ